MILLHAGRCPSAPRPTPDCRHAFAGIIAADDIPVARRVMARGEPKHGLERDVPVEASIVSEDKLIEIRVDVLAAQPVIGAEPPTLHQGEDPVNPWQDHMACHLADRPRVVSVIGEPGIRFVPVGEQRRSGLCVGPHKRLDRSCGVVRDDGEADATRASIQVFRPFPSWLGLVGAAIDHLDGARDKDLPGFHRIKKAVVGPERNFGLVDLHHALQRLALGIDHRPPELLRQQPGGLVCDTELGLELECRHAIGVGCHEVRGPEPDRQGQLGAVHHRASRDRSLTTAAEAFVGVRPALQQCRALAAAGGADKTLWPASLKQERRAARLVRKARLEFAQRSRPCHRRPPRARRVWPAARPLYNISGYLGQRDKLLAENHISYHFYGFALINALILGCLLPKTYTSRTGSETVRSFIPSYLNLLRSQFYSWYSISWRKWSLEYSKENQSSRAFQISVGEARGEYFLWWL